MIAHNVQPETLFGAPIGISIYSVKRERPHIHEGMLELIMCLKGNAKIEVSFETIDLEAGDILAITSHDIHTVRSEVENMFVSMYIDLHHPCFDEDNLDKLFFVCEKGVLNPRREIFMNDIKRMILSSVYLLIDSFTYGSRTLSQAFTRTAEKIVDLMRRHFHIFYFLNQEDDVSQSIIERFENILVYIIENYDKKITLSLLGKREHLDPNYLSSFFKNTVYVGLSQYIELIRSYESERLLLLTEKNVTDIGYECGFSDAKYFYKGFKKNYGLTPLQHRKWYRDYAKLCEDNTAIDYNDPANRHELLYFISKYNSEIELLNPPVK